MQKFELGYWRAWRVWNIFSSSDADSSGTVEGAELEQVHQKVQAWLKLDNETYAELFAQAGGATGGQLDVQELRTFVGVLFSLQQADWNRNHHIEGKELHCLAEHFERMLKSCGVAEGERRWLLEGAGGGADKRLDAGELRRLLTVVWSHVLPKQKLNVYWGHDYDSDGRLKGRELKALALVLRRWAGVPEASYQAVFRECDVAADGELDLQEYTRLVVALRKQSPFLSMSPMMAQKFRGLDLDTSSDLAGKELDALATSQKKWWWLSDQDYQAQLKEADKGADGRLAPLEYLRLDLANSRVSVLAGMDPKEVHLLRKLDWDGNHYINGKELKVLEKKMRWRFGVKKKTYEALLSNAEGSKDGQLGPQELRHLLATLRASGRAKEPAAKAAV